jgi:hypothetical protein
MRIIFLLITTSLIIGCKSQNLENTIVEKIIENCKKDSCSINIKEITKFDWDKMYIFKFNNTKTEIENILKIKVPKYSEFTKKTIFTLSGNIVYYEEGNLNVEGINDNEIVFIMPDSVKYACFSADSAKFYVNTKKIKLGQYYELSK